jgi:flagellar motor switch protein FliN/FliY
MPMLATTPGKDAGPHTAVDPEEPKEQAPPPTGMAGIEHHADWPMLSRLPMLLCAGIPLHKFRVKDLLAIKPGQMIQSDWASTQDVPLKVGGVQLSWIEFEVVEQKMAARLTRLA